VKSRLALHRTKHNSRPHQKDTQERLSHESHRPDRTGQLSTLHLGLRVPRRPKLPAALHRPSLCRVPNFAMLLQIASTQHADGSLRNAGRNQHWRAPCAWGALRPSDGKTKSDPGTHAISGGTLSTQAASWNRVRILARGSIERAAHSAIDRNSAARNQSSHLTNSTSFAFSYPGKAATPLRFMCLHGYHETI